MIIRQYAIYDRVAQEFAPPFMSNNDASAVRAYNKSIPEDLKASDYWLFFIGEYDNSKGKLLGIKDAIRVDTEEKPE